MIAKAKSIGHGGKAIDYALKKDKAEVIDKRFVVGENGTEIKSEFQLFQRLNTRAKNNDLSFVISPEPKDGKALKNSQYRDIANDFLKEMKLDKHQAIVVKHTDKEHTHLHVFVNRIDSNGKAYKDNFISKKAQNIADKIAQSKNLTRARVVQAHRKELQKDFRKEIFHRHKIALSHKPRDFNAYKELMQANGIKVLPTINKANKLQGFRVEFQGVNLKASEVHRQMSLSKITDKALSLNPKMKIAKAITKGITRGL